jgi:hypothetical protein
MASAVTKVRLYEAAGSLAFKLSIHQSKSGKKVNVPFFDEDIEINQNVNKKVVITDVLIKHERKAPADYTKNVGKKKPYVQRFEWSWLYKRARYLEVGDSFQMSHAEATSQNPGCRYQDVQNGLLNSFKRLFREKGFAPESFKFHTSTNKEAGVITIRRIR